MLHATQVVALQYSETTQKPKQALTSTHVILSGIAKLLEGQRCFAKEFGLTYPTILHPNAKFFAKENPRQSSTSGFRIKPMDHKNSVILSTISLNTISPYVPPLTGLPKNLSVGSALLRLNQEASEFLVGAPLFG